jgi:O-antigen/teichoic acid export membrane protein
MFRSALLILSGNAAFSLMLLARNLIIARLISVEDYGIAATFAITMAVVEMMSQLGLQQQIVQAKDGDNRRLQSGLQGFQVLRGVSAGGVLFLAADLIANFLNVPEVAWAYQLMALVPVLNALQHFDIHRLNRHMRFWPVVLTGGVPALISLLAVWPLYIWLGDYQVMLWAIIVQMVLMTIVSHIVAERPYRLLLDRTIMMGALRFGWPLLVNGILMFGVFNGDKLIVGREMGMEALAIFAMGFTLTLTPTLVMAKSAQNFFLPQLSKTDRTNNAGVIRFQHLSMAVLQVSLLNGIILVIIIAAFGPFLVKTLLGDKYSSLIPLLMPLAVLQAFRVAKSGSAVVALSSGHTANAMQANLVRVATLPLVWYALAKGAGLPAVIWIATAGEILGYTLSLWLLSRHVGTPLHPMVWPITCFIFFMGTAAIAPLLLGWAVLVVLMVLMVLGVVMMADLRRYIAQRHH